MEESNPMKQNTQKHEAKCNLCGATGNFTIPEFSKWIVDHNCKFHQTGSDAHNRPSQPTEAGRAWAIANRRLIERNRQIEKVRKLTAQRDALLDALRGACEEHDGAERIIARWYIKAQDAFRLAVNAQQTDTLSPKQK